jgi:hypothetical protein
MFVSRVDIDSSFQLIFLHEDGGYICAETSAELERIMRNLDQRGIESRENGENCITRSFINCTLVKYN